MPYRGRPNASYLVPLTVRAMAEVRGDDLTSCAPPWTPTPRPRSAAPGSTTRRIRGTRVPDRPADASRHAGLAEETPVTSVHNRPRGVCKPQVRRYRLVTDGRDRDRSPSAGGRHAPSVAPRTTPRLHLLTPRWRARAGALAPENRKYDVRRIVPFTEHSKLARLFQSRSLMVALATLVVLAVAGTTLGYAARSKSVTLSLDGQAKRSPPPATPSATSSTPRASTSAATTWSPRPRRGGRPTAARSRSASAARSSSTVDGQTQTHWVTSTKVSSALGEIGRRFAGADLSTSRGGSHRP